MEYGSPVTSNIFEVIVSSTDNREITEMSLSYRINSEIDYYPAARNDDKFSFIVPETARSINLLATAEDEARNTASMEDTVMVIDSIKPNISDVKWKWTEDRLKVTADIRDNWEVDHVSIVIDGTMILEMGPLNNTQDRWFVIIDDTARSITIEVEATDGSGNSIRTSILSADYSGNEDDSDQGYLVWILFLPVIILTVIAMIMAALILRGRGHQFELDESTEYERTILEPSPEDLPHILRGKKKYLPPE
jgi:hypothetical protein